MAPAVGKRFFQTRVSIIPAAGADCTGQFKTVLQFSPYRPKCYILGHRADFVQKICREAGRTVEICADSWYCNSSVNAIAKTGEEAVPLADSNITKRALAAALRELLKERPFAQISVTDICERCEMNRKSFYYHFRDKYDLVNWIYYTEFLAVLRRREDAAGWEVLRDLCLYFEENREFYRKTFEVEGQNSFADYFREIVVVILDDDFEEALAAEEPEAARFYLSFYADAVVAAVKRWLEDGDPVSAETLAARLRRCLTGFEPGTVDHLDEAPLDPPGRTGQPL